jgi:CRISPR/Cas system endoribonuclease Cas6 (RAMP superfamily)
MIIAGPWERAGDWLRALDAIAVGRHTNFGMGRLQWDVPG